MKDASLRSSLKFGLLFVALLFGSLQMFSQANTGRILGKCHFDQTGGAISGATVTVTELPKEARRRHH